MPPRPGAEQTEPLPRNVPQANRHWLLFVHQLPSHPSNLRVRTWRRLQQLGAVPIKQAVYVLPDSPSAREDFEWLKTEVKDAGGEASVFAADSVDAWSDDALVEEFRRSRQEAYETLARDVAKALKADRKARRSHSTAAPAGRRRLVNLLRARLTAIESVDFFGSAGRDRVVSLLKQLEEPSASGAAAAPAGSTASGGLNYHGRLWVTRPRPGVDRMASAWLIRQFIDPHARFGFAPDRDAVPDGALPFDMFGVDFSHQGAGCTFETLCAIFGISDPAVARVAAIVHDLDLKDAHFGAPEATTIGGVIEGLQLAFPEDDVLLAHGMTLFDALFRSLARSATSRASRRSAPRRRRPREGGGRQSA